MSDNDDGCGGPDRLIDLGPCEDGGNHHVLTVKDGEATGIAHMRPIQDGQPLPQNGSVFWTDRGGRVVDSLRLGSGPAQVATPEYRTGWDAIFGKKKAEGLN